ncbi:hypothetical protein ACJX0J_008293, partial [Zea mays]
MPLYYLVKHIIYIITHANCNLTIFNMNSKNFIIMNPGNMYGYYLAGNTGDTETITIQAIKLKASPFREDKRQYIPNDYNNIVLSHLYILQINHLQIVEIPRGAVNLDGLSIKNVFSFQGCSASSFDTMDITNIMHNYKQQKKTFKTV